ncbi:uncharacterized protein DFL_000380 [Arthrobotrys flagrans]|uniref:BTB domain-containing protein n=1 Tax=Arthrobotrys flagrans TaxID=97331 RepID=A0A437AE57_ARTFL|nr:hypothetical protein DFL_000380 [Arthrobotrys flagrans]
MFSVASDYGYSPPRYYDSPSSAELDSSPAPRRNLPVKSPIRWDTYSSKKLSSNNPVEEPEKPFADKPVLTHMFDNAEFSDVTVFAGSTKKPFELHRAVICLTSEFFKTAFKSGSFKEKTTGEFYLSEIEPDVFQKVVAWQYEQGYEYKWTLGKDDLALFQAADFLQIPSLRKRVLDKLATSCVTNLADPTKQWSEELLDNIVKLCDYCNQQDLEVLVRIMGGVLRHWNVSADLFFEGLKSGIYGHVFIAAVVGAQKNAARYG